MSTYANPDKAYVWLDGDIFRAPAGTDIPADPFAATVTTGTTTPIEWDAYGGVEAGFDVNPKRDIKPLSVWNRRNAPYKHVKGPLEERVKFRAVDFSKATVLTSLQGGTITELGTGSGVYRWNPGQDEEFAALFRVVDETGSAGFYVERATLSTPPPRVFGGETLDGFEFELLAMTEIVPLTNFNPLAVV